MSVEKAQALRLTDIRVEEQEVVPNPLAATEETASPEEATLSSDTSESSPGVVEVNPNKAKELLNKTPTGRALANKLHLLDPAEGNLNNISGLTSFAGGGGGGGAGVLSRITLPIGGGYTIGGENFGPYINTFKEWSDDAAYHRGGGGFIQPGGVIVPGPYSVSAGADIAMNWTNSKPIPGAPLSKLNFLSLGVYVTGNFSFIREVAGLGASFIIGAAQVRSGGVDIGSPPSENGRLPTADNWTLNLGGQLFAQAFNGGIRVGVDVRGQPLPLPVTDNEAEINTTAKVGFPPITIFAGFDIFRFFDGE